MTSSAVTRERWAWLAVVTTLATSLMWVILLALVLGHVAPHIGPPLMTVVRALVRVGCVLTARVGPVLPGALARAMILGL